VARMKPWRWVHEIDTDGWSYEDLEGLARMLQGEQRNLHDMLSSWRIDTFEMGSRPLSLERRLRILHARYMKAEAARDTISARNERLEKRILEMKQKEGGG